MVDKVDRRTTDTKERIIQEALHLYKQGGIAAVKLNDITKALQVTRAALYNHFPEGKDQIFLEALASMTHELKTAITGIVDSVSDTRQRLKEILLLVACTPDMKLELLFQVQEELSQPVRARIMEQCQPLMDQVISILQEGMARGELRTVDLPLALLSFVILVKQVDQIMNKRIEFPLVLCHLQETDNLVDQLLDLWFTGMANRTAHDLQS
jgi:AcrR family transcriptional regulator